MSQKYWLFGQKSWLGQRLLQGQQGTLCSLGGRWARRGLSRFAPIRSHPRPELAKALGPDSVAGRAFAGAGWTSPYAATYSALLPDCASTTAMAAMFTISRTEAPSCKMCTGLRMPISTGPMASAPPISCSTL